MVLPSDYLLWQPSVKLYQKESQKLNEEIRKLIQEAIAASNRKAGKSENLAVFSLTPEQKALAKNFTSNKGKLPWPVANGIVKLRFGTNPSPIDPSIKIRSNGVRIATNKGEPIRSVFEGTVQGVMTPKNGNNTIMIRHANYITVYKHLSKFYVSKEDTVTTKQIIGGAPEGVLAAAALRCIGGQMQGRLLFRNDDEISRARKWGIQDLNKKYTLVNSSEENQFNPSVDDFLDQNNSLRNLILLSNPCNPTGITKTNSQLKDLVDKSSFNKSGLLIDEAYELFHEPPISAMSYIKDIDNSNFFLTGAATKGLQAPGIRIGWVVTSKKNIEILGNFSSFGMGGVSRPSQLYALELFNKKSINMARSAIPKFYSEQRDRYHQAFTKLGFEIYSGKGGFYHWCKLPNNITSEKFNDHLFKYGAAILKGTDCDMDRRGDNSVLREFFRFSFWKFFHSCHPCYGT